MKYNMPELKSYKVELVYFKDIEKEKTSEIVQKPFDNYKKAVEYAEKLGITEFYIKTLSKYEKE